MVCTVLYRTGLSPPGAGTLLLHKRAQPHWRGGQTHHHTAIHQTPSYRQSPSHCHPPDTIIPTVTITLPSTRHHHPNLPPSPSCADIKHHPNIQHHIDIQQHTHTIILTYSITCHTPNITAPPTAWPDCTTCNFHRTG